MIESLTQSQIDRFPEFREKWTKIGLCTEPANRKEAEEAIRKSYVLAGLSPPERIVWCGSPMVVISAIKGFFEDKSVSSSVWNSAWSSVSSSVRNSVGSSVRNSVGSFAWNSVSSSVWNSVSSSVWSSVRNSVSSSVWSSVWSSVHNFCYGQHDAWLSYFDYFREVVGLREETEKLTGVIEVAKHAGWWAPYEKICFVSERHNFLSFDTRERLHSLSGPAVTYPNGWKIYAVNGVMVPEQIVEDKQSITIAAIESETNAEVRRVMMEIYGHERYIRDSGAELVAQDELGELYCKELSGDEPLVMVKVINSTPEPDGTSKEYWLRVNPRLRPLLSDGRLGREQSLTARNAIASTFGKYGQEYNIERQT